MKAKFTLALFLISIISFAQVSTYTDQHGNTVDLNNPDQALRHILNNEFTRIVTSNNIGTIGNYVGLSTANNNISLAYSLVQDNSQIWTFEASGASNDQSAILFQDGDFSGGVKLSATYHKIIGQPEIAFRASDIQSIIDKNTELDYNYKKWSIEHKNFAQTIDDQIAKKTKELNDLRSEFKKESSKPDTVLGLKLEAELNTLLAHRALLSKKASTAESELNETLKSLRKIRDDKKNKNPVKKEQFVVDSLKAVSLSNSYPEKIKSLGTELQKTRRAISQNTIDSNKLNTLKNKIELAELELSELNDKKTNISFLDLNMEAEKYNTKEAAIQDNLNKLQAVRATDIKINWISIGGAAESQKFKLFDPNLTQSEQIKSENDIVPTLQFTFSHYENSDDQGSRRIGARKIYYFTASAQVVFGNNLSSLSKVDIQTTDSVSPNRSIVNTTSAYQGDYSTSYVTGVVRLDYYKFIGGIENIGFHLKGECKITKDNSPTLLRAGLLYAALDKNKTSSIVNFEIFYGWNDVFETGTGTNKSFVGIQATFPFNFNLKS